MHIIQVPLFDFEEFITTKNNDRLSIVLDALPSEKLIIALEGEHWTGRKGYPVRSMWAALIAGLLNQCESIADIVRLLKHDKDVRTICNIPKDDIPSDDAFSRFLKKLLKRESLLEECFNDLVEKLRRLLPGFGSKLVVDSTDIPAFSNGNRKETSNKDARWGAKDASHYAKSKAGTDKDQSGKETKKPGEKKISTGGLVINYTCWSMLHMSYPSLSP
jgi:transposase